MDLGAVSRHEPRDAGGDAREAAVVVPVVERDREPALLFTKRAPDLGEHPGQMSFPGGGREPVDEDRRATALREANEEIGLRAEEVRVVGRLDDIRTVTGYTVRPFVATIPDRQYLPDDREVAEITVLELADLLTAENYECEHREHPRYGEIVVHYFHVDGYTVWGATARILVQFLELTTDWRAPARLSDVVDADVDVI